VVDNGDCFQGSGWTQLSRGEAMVPVMNALGYDGRSPPVGACELLDQEGAHPDRVVHLQVVAQAGQRPDAHGAGRPLQGGTVPRLEGGPLPPTLGVGALAVGLIGAGSGQIVAGSN